MFLIECTCEQAQHVVDMKADHTILLSCRGVPREHCQAHLLFPKSNLNKHSGDFLAPCVRCIVQSENSFPAEFPTAQLDSGERWTISWWPTVKDAVFILTFALQECFLYISNQRNPLISSLTGTDGQQAICWPHETLLENLGECPTHLDQRIQGRQSKQMPSHPMDFWRHRCPRFCPPAQIVTA